MIVGDLVERCFNTILSRAGVGRSAFRLLELAITAGAPAPGGTLKLRALPTTGDPAPQALLELDYEVIEIRDYDPNTRLATVMTRGYMETVPADHAIDTKVSLEPDVFKQTVINELKWAIQQLYAWGVYRRRVLTNLLYTTSGVINMPDSTHKKVVSIRVKRSGSFTRYSDPLYEGVDYEQFLDVSSGTPIQLQMFRGGAEGNEMRVVTKSDFDVSIFNENTDLTTLGVPEEIQPDLIWPAAGKILAGQEWERLDLEEIRRLLALAGGNIPPGSAFNISQAFIETFKRGSVASARKRLEEQDPTRFQWVG